MPGQFDPYHKWLGIPPEEQPPHYYRLLAIRIFEDDVDVIEAAADQRMAHLRTLQTGKNAELSQRLLNELAAARACLLDDRRRAKYDAQLRQQQAAREDSAAAGKSGEQALPSPVTGPGKRNSPSAAEPAVTLDTIDDLTELDPFESIPSPLESGYAATAGYYGPPQSAWSGYAPRRRKPWLIPAIIIASILLVFALIAFFAVLAVIVFYADGGAATERNLAASGAADDTTSRHLCPGDSNSEGTSEGTGTSIPRNMLTVIGSPAKQREITANTLCRVSRL